MVAALKRLALGGCAAAASAFTADFSSGMAPFAESSATRYASQAVAVEEGALVLKNANQMYGIAAPVEPPFARDPRGGSADPSAPPRCRRACRGAAAAAAESLARTRRAAQRFDPHRPWREAAATR